MVRNWAALQITFLAWKAETLHIELERRELIDVRRHENDELRGRVEMLEGIMHDLFARLAEARRLQAAATAG